MPSFIFMAYLNWEWLTDEIRDRASCFDIENEIHRKLERMGWDQFRHVAVWFALALPVVNVDGLTSLGASNSIHRNLVFEFLGSDAILQTRMAKSHCSLSIWCHWYKVKCTLVQALRLCTGRTSHRESRGIALTFLDHGARRGWGVNVTLRPLFTPRKDPVTIVQEAGWALGPVWTGAENLASTAIRSPDRPTRSQSLYRLRYPAHWSLKDQLKNPVQRNNRCLLWEPYEIHK
jgi:hypothetical protein